MELSRSMILISALVFTFFLVFGAGILFPAAMQVGYYTLGNLDLSQNANIDFGPFLIFGFFAATGIAAVFLMFWASRINVAENEKDGHIHNRYEFLRPKREI